MQNLKSMVIKMKNKKKKVNVIIEGLCPKCGKLAWWRRYTNKEGKIITKKLRTEKELNEAGIYKIKSPIKELIRKKIVIGDKNGNRN